MSLAPELNKIRVEVSKLLLDPNNPRLFSREEARVPLEKVMDPGVQDDMKHWPFKVKAGSANTPIIEVEYKGELKQFKAEEISSHSLPLATVIYTSYFEKNGLMIVKNLMWKHKNCFFVLYT